MDLSTCWQLIREKLYPSPGRELVAQLSFEPGGLETQAGAVPMKHLPCGSGAVTQ